MNYRKGVFRRSSRPRRPLTIGETAGLCGGLAGTPIMFYAAADILCSSDGLGERLRAATIPIITITWGVGMVISAWRKRYDVEPH